MKRFNTVQDIRRYLASVINKVDQGELDQGTAGKLGYLCSILHKVIIDSDIESRLTALEKKIQNQGVHREK